MQGMKTEYQLFIKERKKERKKRKKERNGN